MEVYESFRKRKVQGHDREGLTLQNITVQRFEDSHAERLSEIIKKNLLEVNINDYEDSLMERIAESYSPERIREIAAQTHMYVVLREDEPVACGAIAPVDGNPEESYMLAIFANVEMHGKGLGKVIMKALEEDEYGTRFPDRSGRTRSRGCGRRP